MCGISYPFSHSPKCDVCGEQLDGISNDGPDKDWEYLVEMHKASRNQKIERDTKIRDWKLLQLMNLGFSEVASALLFEWKVDHHRLAKMLSQGCTHVQALEIFRPIVMPPSAEAEPVQEAAAAVQ